MKTITILRRTMKMNRKGSTLVSLIMAFIMMLVGLALIPTIQSEQDTATGSGLGKGNLTGAAKTVTGLTTLFFALLLIGGGIVQLVLVLRKAGGGGI